MLRWDFLGNFKEGSAPVGITHDGEMFVIMLGASITNSLVDTGAKRSVMEAQLAAAGYQARVFDKATGGDKVNTLLTHIRDEGLLDPFLPYASKCRCVIHIGGNNASSGAYPAEAVEIDTKLREIVIWLQDRNFNVVLSPISYRVPPASNPTEPYNTNIVEPIINEFTPEWVRDGVPLYNLHKYFFENQGLLGGDGIHLLDPVGEDATRIHVGDTIINNIAQTPNPDTEYLVNAIVNFGSRPSEIIGDYGNISQGALTTDKLVNVDFSGITNGTSITASEGIDTAAGRVVASELGPVITNNSLIRRGMYGETISLDFSSAGLDPSATYTVKFTGSRDGSTGTRVNEVTVNGVMQEMNAEANPPEVLEWTGVNGATLASAAGLITTTKAGSSNVYLSALQIIKEQ